MRDNWLMTRLETAMFFVGVTLIGVWGFFATVVW